jgi:formyl-CoA transferase
MKEPKPSASQTDDLPPLSGFRVLDLTQVIAGPYGTLMLGDLGAEVVKIERPGTGDDLRTVGRYPGRDQHEDYFNANNRSKKSITLDLKEPEGRRIGQELAKVADVVVENFAPGTAHRLGMGWEDLEPLNPRLVYCSLSGFGQTGPYRDRFALDPMIQAITGLMTVTGDPEGQPTMVGAPLCDVMAGMFAAYSIVSALHAVRRSGKGRRIDISMQDATLAALGPRMGESLQAGLNPARVGNQNPQRVPANTYRTRDGAYLSLIVQNDRHWPRFCKAMGFDGLLDEPKYARGAGRVADREKLDRMTADRVGELTYDECAARLEGERLPYARVKTYLEALEDEQVAVRGIVRTLDHPTSGKIRVVGPPWIMSGTQAEMMPPPTLGQHSREILRSWLGWADDAIDRACASSEAAE